MSEVEWEGVGGSTKESVLDIGRTVCTPDWTCCILSGMGITTVSSLQRGEGVTPGADGDKEWQSRTRKEKEINQRRKGGNYEFYGKFSVNK